jgi:hypothetical protein
MNNNLDDLKKLILEKFDIIEKKLDLIIENESKNEKKISEIKVDCQKMGDHIDFIEDTYNVLQTPLNYVKRQVERIIGSSSKDLKVLPIKDKENDKEL